jgi:hypothetical protein
MPGVTSGCQAKQGYRPEWSEVDFLVLEHVKKILVHYWGTENHWGIGLYCNSIGL